MVHTTLLSVAARQASSQEFKTNRSIGKTHGHVFQPQARNKHLKAFEVFCLFAPTELQVLVSSVVWQNLVYGTASASTWVPSGQSRARRQA